MSEECESITFDYEKYKQVFPKRLSELNNAYHSKDPHNALSAFDSDADLKKIVIDAHEICNKYDIKIESDPRYGFRAIKGGNILTPDQNPEGDKTSYLNVELLTDSGFIRMYLPWENMPQDSPKRSIAVFLKGKATEEEAETIVSKMIKALG